MQSSGIAHRGLMLVLSSPSGAGKTTISRKLMDGDGNLTMSVSATTRPRRPGEEDGAAPLGGLLRAADDHAGFHRRVVEEIRPEAEDAFKEVELDELAAHLGLFVAEQDAVREEDGAATGLGV